MDITVVTKASGEEFFPGCQYEVLQGGDLAIFSKEGNLHLFLKENTLEVKFSSEGCLIPQAKV